MFKNFQPFDLLILLFAFLYGNLFVITFSSFQWGLFVIFFVVFILELVNKLLYQSFFQRNNKKQRSDNNFISKAEFLRKEKEFKKPIKSFFFLLLTFKRGFLLGFFVEAFKVGS